MAKNVSIDGNTFKVGLIEQSDGGVDFCIDTWRGIRSICKLTNDGELMLYADVPEELKRTKSNRYIRVIKEMG